jgi:hypothetical protein
MRCCPFSPTAVGYLSQRVDLLSLGDQKTKWASVPNPNDSIVSPIFCKGTGSFTSHAPLGMPQNARRLIDKQ